MFRTKRDVDRHVNELLRKIKNENERNLRCYNIAQQYFKVRDYKSAKQYLSMYLSVKEYSPSAHKLQGQIWENLGDKVRALDSYKTSLELEAKQPDLVLKMCELLCDTDVAMDTDRAHYWCERGENLFPHDPAIFRLKEKLLKVGGKANTQAFEELINSEIKARPNDVSVRTRLMRLYIETGRTKAAFSHAVELEASQMFHKEFPWYECFAQVCQSYADEFPSQVDWQFYITWVSVLDRVACLSMYAPTLTRKLVDCVQSIFSLDQVLFKATSKPPKENSQLYKHFMSHMSAQLCLHIATLILKRAKKEPSNWREATTTVSMVLFLALNPPPDVEAPWCLALPPNLKRSLAQWSDDAYYRVSQAGYTLLSLAKGGEKEFLDKVNHMASNNWRERMFQRIFTVLDHRACISTSHFVHSELLAKVSVKLPKHDSGFLRTRQLVPVYEKVRSTLHYLVWLGLEIAKQNDNKLPPDFHTYSFSRLKLTTPNLANVSPDTLSVLDIDSFLYATVLCAVANLQEEILNGFYSSDRPLTLPADIYDLLCTQEQINWWKAVRQVNSQQFSNGTNIVVLRQQLQRGLEVVRVEGNHGLDVQLIVKLARTFVDRAANVTGKSSDQSAMEKRALLYWNAALPLLERMERNQAICITNSKLFDYRRKELSSAEVCSLLEEGRFFVACQLMKSEHYERAIEAFKPLRSPYASFNQAMIYKKLAAAELEERPREEITSEMRSKHVILLSKARECLNLTWERIRIDRRHPLHDTLPEHISEVETALSRIEPDPDMDRNILGTSRSLDLSLQRLGMSYHSSNLNRSDVEGNLSEPSLSSVGSPAAGDMGLHHHMTPRLNGRAHKQSSTPRHNQQWHSDYRRGNTNGEFVDVGQLLQIQTLHEEMKKMHDKLELIIENMNEMRRDLNKLKPPVTEDLYMFGGEEEEYPEEVLSGQYPQTFVPSYPTPPQPAPSFYPTPPRGVQGTSTVTYGAPPLTQQPPVIPLIPMRVPLDPTLAGYQTPQNLAFYNQGTLPFTEPQHLPEFLRPTPAAVIPKPVIQQSPPPVNVVITTSDTLPTGPPPVQPTLSVTIPPQHRLGTLPMCTPPVIISTPVPTTAITTPPVHKFQIAMPSTATIPNLEKSPIVIPDEVESEDDNEVGYDPCPDFRPIVPLPNEVNVTTGEEDDEVLFENRAKLFRFVEKEWKERGIGVVKILKNKTTQKVRLLMRRDQVHKVCANHLLRSDMELTELTNSDRALVWVANDFAEECVRLEKFCIKFKTKEEASKFRDVFDDAKVKYGQSPTKPIREKESKSDKSVEDAKLSDFSGKVNLGGFTFTSPPKLKEPIDEKAKPKVDSKKESQPAPSPFAAFTFTPQKIAVTSNIPSTKSNILKQPVLTPPLFAGLNSTQNKHSLFDDTNDETTPQPIPTTKDSYFKVSNETSSKTVLNEPVLPSVQPLVPNLTILNKDISKNTTSKVAPVQPKTVLSFTTQTTVASTILKETPKSILKEPIVSNSSNAPVSGTKTSPVSKHVLFQDTTVLTPSQQTPTLAAMLSSPKTPVLDFAALSKMNENSSPAFSSDKPTGGFKGAGSAVFSTSRVRNDSEGETAEEFVPSAEFKPVIPLPELVEVKTGEEGEDILFNERSKLMRFDPETKEWKERGLGQMKILKDPATGITRFLMRREQIHKVCCNHRIIQSLELKQSPSSEKAWTWYAVDYSEGEIKNELFAIRFKTVELAKSFKETVDKVQKRLREEGTSKRSCPDSVAQEEAAPLTTSWKCTFCSATNTLENHSCKSCSKQKADNLPKLSELFRPKAGSWECKACYTVNGAKDSTCVSCDSPKEKPKSPGPATPPTTTIKEKTAPSGVSLAEMFKPKVGSWECGGCLVRNDADKTICPACSTPKPGHENDAKETKTPSFSFGSTTFSFGIKPTDDKAPGFSFGIKTNEDTSKNPITFGIKPVESQVLQAAPTPSTGVLNLKKDSTVNKATEKTNSVSSTGFSFGQTKSSSPFTFASKAEVVATSADSTTPVFEVKPPSTAFKFGNLTADVTTPSKASFMFGASSPPNQSADGDSKFAFGQSGKFEFTFSGVKPSSGNKSPRSPGTGQDSDSEPEELEDEEGDHLVFQPVVPLPDRVPLTTGEENEEVLYIHRAKLYRFDKGEWKERGVGDIKILRHNDTQKIRLLMRREPILKICLNHWLTPDIHFTPKDDKSWLWSAQDFAEGSITSEQFCLRLKTPEIASEFKTAIDSAQGEVQAATSPVKVNSKDVAADHEDVEIVYEAKVSDALREAALKLRLPPNFYSYLDAAPCPGCAGCEPDSEEEEVAKSLVASPPITKNQPIPMSSSSLVATTVSRPFTFTVKTTTAPSTSAPAPSTFGLKFNTSSPSVTVAETTTSSIFNLNSVPATTPQTTSSFGGPPLIQSQTGSKSFFGPASLNQSGPPMMFGSTSSTQSATTLSFGSNPKTTSSPFGGTAENQTTKTFPFLNASPTSSIFGGSSSQSPVSSFGTPTETSGNSPKGSSFFSNLGSFQSPQNSVFGGKSPSTTNQTSLFGTPIASQTSSVFGTPTAETPLLGAPTTVFGVATTPQTPLFGTSTTQSSAFGIATTTQKPLFGTTTTTQSSAFGIATTTQTPLFGSTTTTQTSLLGTPNITSMFGGTTHPPSGLFSNLGTQKDNSTNDAPSFLFKQATTFSDIAETNKKQIFENDKENSNFAWAGAGAKVFDVTKGSTKTKEDESGEESGGEDADAETPHDPTFEPIVPLPNIIEVRTGEEEEDKEFCSRAKFYRYDTESKEWKERGVGEMKILRHRETNTYRLLLRREQVHKVVCNQLITQGLELQNLANSDKSFCWAAMNMAEEYSEPQLEKVAVRFKNSDTAQQFKDKLEECINLIIKTRNEKSSPHQSSVVIEEVSTEYSDGEGEGEYLDEDVDPMFVKRATLHCREHGGRWLRVDQGELSIIFNHDMNLSNVLFKKDSGDIIAIAPGQETNIQKVSDKEVSWYGLDHERESDHVELAEQEYKAEFCTSQAAEEFLSTFSEVIELSQTFDSSYVESEPED